MRLDPTGKDLYLYDARLAYVQMERYEEAIPILRQHLTAYPNLLIGRMSLIVAYTELGRDQDARAEAAQIMRIIPQFTLASLPRAKDAVWNKQLRDNLQKAGLK